MRFSRDSRRWSMSSRIFSREPVNSFMSCLTALRVSGSAGEEEEEEVWTPRGVGRCRERREMERSGEFWV